MALPILDGNQTSTTLATTISGGAHYPNHIIAEAVTIGSLPSISGSVTISNAITISSLPALAGGTNRIGVVTIGAGTVTIGAGTSQIGSVTASISGTVTANGGDFNQSIFDALNNYAANANDRLPTITTFADSLPAGSNVIGQVQLYSSSVALSTGGNRIGVVTASLSAGTAQIGSVTASISGTPSVTFTAITGSTSIIGTPAVTFTAIVLPSGTLTTRFGSVTTANTAQISTAVTNTSRKYLLIQNNQTGTSAGAATIGIGFTPTTTQGIQLIAGASYVADSFVPTGAVYWLGSVTGAVFTIVEG